MTTVRVHSTQSVRPSARGRTVIGIDVDRVLEKKEPNVVQTALGNSARINQSMLHCLMDGKLEPISKRFQCGRARVWALRTLRGRRPIFAF